MISLFEFRDASEQYGKHEEQEDPGENHVATADGAQPKDNREDGPTQQENSDCWVNVFYMGWFVSLQHPEAWEQADGGVRHKESADRDESDAAVGVAG